MFAVTAEFFLRPNPPELLIAKSWHAKSYFSSAASLCMRG
jgi:hypothetical protein